MQFDFNNAFNVIIDQTFNQFKYEFSSRDLTSLIFIDQSIAKKKTVDLIFAKMTYRKKAANVMIYVNAQMKLKYDDKHKPLRLQISDYAYLRLHHEYQFFNKLFRKFFNQYSESFLIKRWVDLLIYELELSITFKIHSIIFVIQLKSTNITKNFYKRFKSDYFESIEIEKKNFVDVDSRYKVKKMIDRRQRTFEKIKMWQYLFRWRDWKSKNDIWKFEFACEDCMNLMKQYERQHSRKIIRKKRLRKNVDKKN